MDRRPIWTLLLLLSTAVCGWGQDDPQQKPLLLPPPQALKEDPLLLKTAPSTLTAQTKVIDLTSALHLAGIANPEIQIARERVVEALAYRQLAAAQLLPNLNVGFNLNYHSGNLQQANGNLIKVNRDAMYVGLGAGAVGGGTVTIPGISWNANVSEVLFRGLVSRQRVHQARFASEAVRNNVLLRVTGAYLDLLRAEGFHAIASKSRDEAQEVARVTANFAKTGKGRLADAQRAATEFEQRNNDVLQAESELAQASARLCQLLDLDPSVRLRPLDGWVVPHALVPQPIPLPELLAIALMQRPELKERQAALRAAFLELRSEQCLPFAPNLLIGFSSGTFGGGSNLQPNQPRLGNFDARQDFDLVLYWTARNLGVGNVALIRAAKSRLRQDQWREVEMLDRVRAEVAMAQARTAARYEQLAIGESAVTASGNAFQQDLSRTRNAEGLPIEVLDSLRLLFRSRLTYLNAIIDYNRAQFELYVALGQPPAAQLARPVPNTLVPMPAEVAPK